MQRRGQPSSGTLHCAVQCNAKAHRASAAGSWARRLSIHVPPPISPSPLINSSTTHLVSSRLLTHVYWINRWYGAERCSRLDVSQGRGEFFGVELEFLSAPLPLPLEERGAVYLGHDWLAGQLLVGSDEPTWTREQLKLVAVYYCIVLFYFKKKNKFGHIVCQYHIKSNYLTEPPREQLNKKIALMIACICKCINLVGQWHQGIIADSIDQ